MSAATGPELSVVIPTLDEAYGLPHLLRQLREQEGVALEVIVADGGSRDGTVERARHGGARVVAGRHGRGAQMNQGAAAAAAPLLLFLHADSELVSPTALRDAVAALRRAVADGPRVAGHFALRFARRSLGHGLFYRFLEQKTRTNRPGTIHGDQGLMVPATYFHELGGFDERLPFLEDHRFAERVFATGRWLLLPGKLLTSARRFEAEGHYRRYTLMSLIMGMHEAGVETFFARAPRVYAVQSETGRLRLSPYLALARELLVQAGWREALGILLRVGRYARQNAWQPFFWLDVLLRPLTGRRNPFLWLHDRVFRPVTDNRLFDGLAAALVGAWFLVVLPVAFALVDGGRR